MRIIAGSHRSRKLKTLEGTNTRPTQDKIKEAVFASIGAYFDGGIALDLFAGSGSIGLECISRGCEKAYFFDCNKEAITIIKQNISLLEVVSKSFVQCCDYQKALQYCENIKFSFIYMDPPYALHVINECIAFINEHAMLEDNGVLVIESKKEETFNDRYGQLIKKKEKCYGITKITYFRKELSI